MLDKTADTDLKWWSIRNPKPGKNDINSGVQSILAEYIDIGQRLTLALENDADLRISFYLWFTKLFVEFRGAVIALRSEQFGIEPLDKTNTRILAAQCLESIAKLCRGRISLPKGRENTDLAWLMNLLAEHKKEKLTARELKEALAYAGVFIGSEEHVRLAAHRLRKKGLLGKRQERSIKETWLDFLASLCTLLTVLEPEELAKLFPKTSAPTRKGRKRKK